MAIVIKSSPERYGLAYNDNPYVFLSTNYAAGQRFRVGVLQQGAPPLAIERVYPRPSEGIFGNVYQDRAYYDPSRILQTQVKPFIRMATPNHATILDASVMRKNYSMFITEELLQPDGTYVDGDRWDSELKTVWNGVRNTLDWLDFDYNDFDISQNNKRFLTDAPTTQYIDSNQSAFLYFFTEQADVAQVRLRGYDATGANITNGFIDVSSGSKFNRVAIGTYDIENSDASDWSTGNPTTFLNGVTYYRVNVLTASGTSETITYYVNKRCSKYTPIRLHWLNRMGGFDSFNFSLKSMQETDIERGSYRKQHHRMGSSSWLYDQSSRGTTDYNIQTMDKLTVNTPFLTEAESVWMNDFATSPVIYQELNNKIIAMSGKAKMINKKTSLNDKLMQYTFELDYSLVNHRQRG